jgi:hypothetical protein
MVGLDTQVTLKNFFSFLKTLLDDINVLTENQLRILFRIIFQSSSMIVEKEKIVQVQICIFVVLYINTRICIYVHLYICLNVWLYMYV